MTKPLLEPHSMVFNICILQDLESSAIPYLEN